MTLAIYVFLTSLFISLSFSVVVSFCCFSWEIFFILQLGMTLIRFSILLAHFLRKKKIKNKINVHCLINWIEHSCWRKVQSQFTSFIIWQNGISFNFHLFERKMQEMRLNSLEFLIWSFNDKKC